MRLNKFYLLLVILFCIILFSCTNNLEPIQDTNYSNTSENFIETEETYIDIVPLMLDGLENELIQKLYGEWIRDVYEITFAKYIRIWYYEIDLNDNGHDDLIVIIQSPLHSGSRGDSTDIWINKGNGEYYNTSWLTVRILASDPEYNGQIYILDEKTNGFKNINIVSENDIELIYKDGRYVFK